MVHTAIKISNENSFGFHSFNKYMNKTLVTLGFQVEPEILVFSEGK